MNATLRIMLFDLKSLDVVRVIADVDAPAENQEPEPEAERWTDGSSMSFWTIDDHVRTAEKRPPRLLLRESPMGSCHRDGTFWHLPTKWYVIGS